MSALDKLHTIQTIINVVSKVLTVADRLIDFVITQVTTKGV